MDVRHARGKKEDLNLMSKLEGCEKVEREMLRGVDVQSMFEYEDEDEDEEMIRLGEFSA